MGAKQKQLFLVLFFFLLSSAKASGQPEEYELNDWLQHNMDLALPSVVKKKYSGNKVKVESDSKFTKIQFSFTNFGNLRVQTPSGTSESRLRESLRESLATQLVLKLFNQDFKDALSRISLLKAIAINNSTRGRTDASAASEVQAFVLRKLLNNTRARDSDSYFQRDLELWWRLRWNPTPNPVFQSKVALLVGKVYGTLPRLPIPIFKSVAAKADMGHSIMGLIRINDDPDDDYYLNPGSNPKPGEKAKVLPFLFGVKPHVQNSVVSSPFWDRLYQDTEDSGASTYFRVMFPNVDQVKALDAIVKSRKVPMGIFALLYRNCAFGSRDILNSILPLDAEIPFSGMSVTLPGFIVKNSRVLFQSTGGLLKAASSTRPYAILPRKTKPYDSSKKLANPEEWQTYQMFMERLRADQQRVIERADSQ